MPWNNGPIALYHGTDDISATLISQPSSSMSHSINLNLSDLFTDFGRGFYTTTNLNQAKNWANIRYDRTQNTPNPANYATVLQFDVNRNLLAPLNTLCFVTESSSQDYWDFITHCRGGVGPHLFLGSGNYDVVFGPVSLWRQKFVIKDCDQVSFHTPAALAVLHTPVVADQGNPTFP